MREIKLAPSLLAADFANLAAAVSAVEDTVDWLHLDVMDGHFVPNISFGIPVIAALRPQTSLFFDCHLMTTNPDAFLTELAEAGADLVSMHIEAVPNPVAALQRGRDAGLAVGLVLNPGTPEQAVEPYLDLVDLVLVMSVEPGFGGQSFIESVLSKVENLREMVENRGLPADIQIDGGISPETVGLAAKAGANVFVAGTAIFGEKDPGVAAGELRRIIRENE